MILRLPLGNWKLKPWSKSREKKSKKNIYVKCTFIDIPCTFFCAKHVKWTTNSSDGKIQGQRSDEMGKNACLNIRDCTISEAAVHAAGSRSPGYFRTTCFTKINKTTIWYKKFIQFKNHLQNNSISTKYKHFLYMNLILIHYKVALKNITIKLQKKSYLNLDANHIETHGSIKCDKVDKR